MNVGALARRSRLGVVGVDGEDGVAKLGEARLGLEGDVV